MMAIQAGCRFLGRRFRGVQGKQAVQFLLRGKGRFHVLHAQRSLVKIVEAKDGFPAGLVPVDLRGVDDSLLGVLDGKVGLVRGQLKLFNAGSSNRGNGLQADQQKDNAVKGLAR